MRTKNSVMLFWTLFLIMAGAARLVSAADIDIRSVVLATVERQVTAQLFQVRGDARRPAVIILHGAHGIDLRQDFFRHYATVLAESGIDAYLLTYYNEDDAKRIKDNENLLAVARKRMRAWSTLVSNVIGDILVQRQSSGRIGLLGFSRGGFLATAVGNQDPRVSALAVFYGGIPSILRDDMAHLPPLIELHGDADPLVPLREGKALVDLAHRLGQQAEMVVYPGAGHGFKGADAEDSERRTIAFFQRQLMSSR
jgi:carboxymethylenebutenolidase